MTAEASSLPYSPQQVIGEAFALEPAKLFKNNDHGVVQLDGPLLHMQIFQTEGANILLLMAELGALPANKRTEYHRSMLKANIGWLELAGGTLCTDDSGDAALLRLRLELDTLNAEILVQWLEAFVIAAEDWCERVAAPDSSSEASDAEEIDPRRAIPAQEFAGFLPFNLA